MTFLQLVDLVDLQARATLKAEASRLYLSYVWWVLEPLLFVAVFYVVFKIFLNRGGEDFVLFLMCGKVPYLWVNKSVMSAGASILGNKGLIGRIDVPKEIFPYIAMQEVLYKQWVVFLVLFLATFYFGYMPDQSWLWLIPVVLTTYLMLIPMSLIAALLMTWAQDFRILIQMGMLFLMFASGIFWDINDIANEHWREMLLTLNPMAFLIDCYRRIMMYGTPIDHTHLAALAGICLIVTMGVHATYRSLRFKITQHVLQQ